MTPTAEHPMTSSVVRLSSLTRRTGALTLAALMAIGAVLPAQARTPSRKKAPTAAAPAVHATPGAPVVGDYIVAVVESTPVTNREVNLRADLIAHDLTARHAAVPERAALLKQALNDLILRKAAISFAKKAGLTASDEEVNVRLQEVAAQNQTDIKTLLARVQTDRHLTPAQYRQELADQIAVERLRQGQIASMTGKVTDADALAYLREQQAKAGAGVAPVEMLNLAQIIIAVPRNADAATVQQLQAKAEEALAKLRSGTDFATVVHDYTDGSGRTTGGVMGLLPAAQYPAEFTSAVQNVPAGQTTGIIRTVAGFHTLKVVDRQQTTAVMTVPELHVRHILLRTGPKLTQAQALAELTKLRQQITAGKRDFADAARAVSEDGSAQQGGDLGWTPPDVFVPEFTQQIDRLQPGQISAPFVTRFGVHLAQLLGRRAMPMTPQQELEAARAALRQQKEAAAGAEWERNIRARAYVELREAAH